MRPSRKGQDSVRYGINCLLEKKIHIVDGSINLIKEAKRYTWKRDKNNNPLPVPIEGDDHLVTATRYAIYTKYGQKKIDTGVASPCTVNVRGV